MSKVKELNQEVRLTETELKDLKAIVGEINEVQMQIGGIEAHKHELLHSIALKTTTLKDLQKTLEETYGAVNIDLNTGIVTDAPNS
tara:strand:- start:1338 stop:1595 length:258 start_codon:yes stop_codon:yes gene_type:complete